MPSSIIIWKTCDHLPHSSTQYPSHPQSAAKTTHIGTQIHLSCKFKFFRMPLTLLFSISHPGMHGHHFSLFYPYYHSLCSKVTTSVDDLTIYTYVISTVWQLPSILTLKSVSPIGIIAILFKQVSHQYLWMEPQPEFRTSLFLTTSALETCPHFTSTFLCLHSYQHGAQQLKSSSGGALWDQNISGWC